MIKGRTGGRDFLTIILFVKWFWKQWKSNANFVNDLFSPSRIVPKCIVWDFWFFKVFPKKTFNGEFNCVQVLKVGMTRQLHQLPWGVANAIHGVPFWIRKGETHFFFGNPLAHYSSQIPLKRYGALVSWHLVNYFEGLRVPMITKLG